MRFTHFLNVGKGKRCPLFVFIVSRPLDRHATKTMAELGAGKSCGSTSKSDNEDKRGRVMLMQEMMGTLVKEVTEIEKKYSVVSKAKHSSGSVCEHAEQEMTTASGRSEEDNVSSILAESRREKRVGNKSKGRYTRLYQALCDQRWEIKAQSHHEWTFTT